MYVCIYVIELFAPRFFCARVACVDGSHGRLLVDCMFGCVFVFVIHNETAHTANSADAYIVFAQNTETGWRS